MNPAKRILVVARKFWPHVDEACHRLLGWCNALQRRGISVRVLTARWHSSWPDHLTVKGIRIDRLLPAPTSNWNEGHFQKNVTTWIGKHLGEFDLIYVDRSDGLLATIGSKAVRWGKPVVSRFVMDMQPIGLAKSQWLAPIAAADACRRCVKIVTPNVFSQRLLISHGVEARSIVRIEDAAWAGFPRTIEARNAASTSLFDVSSDFVVPGRTDLVLHFGHADPKSLLHATMRICDLLDAGASIRMWIVGCDLPPEPVYQAIKSRGWHREILIFPGFDDVEELIAVADLAIVSNPSSALQFSAPTFANSDLPMIMTDSVESRNWLPETHHFGLYGNTDGLYSILQNWLTNRQQWETDAIALRVWMRRNLPTEKVLDMWMNLFRDVDKQSTG